MIHQHIFASPKPGMTETAFQDYWINVHAVKYASKIKQIRKYLIDTRIDAPGQTEPPIWNGIAEIWIKDEKEQLESLQSPEFLQGARLDEPNWAAFWNTQVVDTDAHVILEGSPLGKSPERVKVVTLIKRKAGMPVEDFRLHGLNNHAGLVMKLPGLSRYLQCYTRDSWYAVGEPRFDGVTQLWFENMEALQEAMKSSELKAVAIDKSNFLESKYLFSMACREHWIIGPEPRYEGEQP